MVGDVIKSPRLQHRFHKRTDVVSLSDLEPDGALGNGWLVVRAYRADEDGSHGWHVVVKMLSGGNGGVFEAVIGISFAQSGRSATQLLPGEITLIEEVDIEPELSSTKRRIKYTL